ncbi:hypothetical protein SAMN04490247_0674 [Salimicrobium halophilum]|uniref:Uncharacterized protein n=1 Tax=Salimicrobium halophilum TaxID=86666 RepID=A0A1G8QWK5_9BACI|nr:hypothetical protein SAMN04490247_0674 [Salimicrobium halophilum]
MVVTFSLVIIKEYYPEFIILDTLTWSLLFGVMGVVFLAELVTSRFLNKNREVRSEKVSISLFTYLYCLWFLVNLLPGSNPEAAFSMEGNLFIVCIILVLLLNELYQFMKKKKGWRYEEFKERS